jgi:hypothetical protein
MERCAGLATVEVVQHHPHPTLPLKGRAFKSPSLTGRGVGVRVGACDKVYRSEEFERRLSTPSPPNPPLEGEGFQDLSRVPLSPEEELG